MRAQDPALAAAQAGAVVGLAQLLLIQLPSADIALCTGNGELVYDGRTYRGVGVLGTISEVKDSTGEVAGLQMELNGGDASLLAVALDGGDEFQVCPITLYTVTVDLASGTIVGAEVEWSGYGDTFAVEEDGEQARIRCTAESDQVDLLRGRPLTASDADHQSVYPGDRAYEYRQSQAGQPVVWPAKEYFYQ